MRFKATFILLGVLILVSAYVYFVEIRGKDKKERIEAKANKLLAFEQEQIARIEVSRGNTTITLARGEEGWNLISPVTAKADSNTAESYVSTIISAKREREIETDNDDVSLKDFGLYPALYTVIATGKDGTADTVLIGEKNPTNMYVFAKKPSNPNIFCTGTLVQTELQKTTYELRDKTILPFEKTSVHRIRIQSQKGEILLVRSGETWQVEHPIQVEADDQSVDDWLNDLDISRIERFEEENPGSYVSYGLDPPNIRILLTIGSDNIQKELTIGNRDGDVYYARDSALTPVFVLDSTLVQDLNMGLFEFRDKTIAKFTPDEVEAIELDYSDRPRFVCSKAMDESWRIVEPDTAEAKGWRISSLISDIIGMKATGFIGVREKELGQYGLEDPEIKIILKDKNDNQVAHILIGTQSGEDNVFVMNRITGWVYQTDSSIQENLRLDIEEIAEESDPEQVNEQ